MGKVILITGVSSGIGAETAKRLALQGNIVYGAARRVELIPDGVIPVRMDITDRSSVEDCVQRIIKEQGRIDVLVNNAGYGYFGAIENVSMDEARRQLDVNLFGLAELTRMVLPHMRLQHSGRIINVASVAGRAVIYLGGWYNISKYAVEAFSDALRMEIARFGIKVSIIEPGSIQTNWGVIAASHLAESSAGTPYQEEGMILASNLENFFKKKGLFSHPSVVSRTIIRAVNSRRPRTRYRTGMMSRSIVFFHSILPDRWWDSIARLSARRVYMKNSE